MAEEIKKENQAPKNEKKVVEVPKEKLDEILSLVKNQGKVIEEQAKRLADIEENGVSQRPKIAKKIKEHYCTLRKYKDKIVKGIKGSVYKEWNEREKEFYLYVDLELEDGKIAEKVDYLEFINNAEKVKVKILEKTTAKRETVEAYVNQKQPQGEFGTLITDVVVPIESIVEEYSYDVELPNGKKMVLNERAINM